MVTEIAELKQAQTPGDNSIVLTVVPQSPPELNAEIPCLDERRVGLQESGAQAQTQARCSHHSFDYASLLVCLSRSGQHG